MSLAIKSFYEFDEFRLDNKKKVLFKRDKPVAVTPKMLQLLAVLVENHGHIVKKDDFWTLSTPQQLTNFNTEHIFYFDWSRDGKIFAFSRGSSTSIIIATSMKFRTYLTCCLR